MTSDEAFLERFERAAISKPEWDHRAHVRVIHQLLVRASLPEAVERVRTGIPRLNRAHGVPNTDTGGYHETLTIAWACLVAERMGSDDASVGFEAFIAAHPELMRRDLVLEHYSEQCLFSVRARREPVRPDRRELPGFEQAS